MFSLTDEFKAFASRASGPEGENISVIMTQIITATILLLSIFMGAPAYASAQSIEIKWSGSQVSYTQPMTLEQHVRDYYKLNPILAEIAKCESRFRQYDSKGRVLRGEMVRDDVGLMQINEFFHKATAEKLGYDLETVEGNLDYGLYLYNKEGTRPWNASKGCWSKANITENTYLSNLLVLNR